MDVKSPEVEEQRPEVVKLNQEFRLFDPQFTRRTNPVAVGADRVLQLEGLPDLPLAIGIDHSVQGFRKGEIIVPYQPELGYQIDQNDSNPEKRKQKISENYEDLTQFILDKTEANNQEELEVYLDLNPERRDYGLKLLIPGTEKINPEYQTILERLRLHVILPMGEYESPATDVEDLLWSDVNFSRFYPLDTGPLPKDRLGPKDIVHDLSSFYLFIPNDLKKLSEISAKFVLAPERRK